MPHRAIPGDVGCLAVAPSFAVTERQVDAHRRAAQEANVSLEDYLHGRAVQTTLLQRLVLAEDLGKAVCFLCSPLSWTINATTVELAGGSSPDIHSELEPHPPWGPGTAR